MCSMNVFVVLTGAKFAQTLLLCSSIIVCVDLKPLPPPTVADRLLCNPIGYCPRTCLVCVSVRRQV